jgi:hypothetical protein
LFLWFQTVHVPKMIRVFSPPLAILEIAMPSPTIHQRSNLWAELQENAAPLAAVPYTKTAPIVPKSGIINKLKTSLHLSSRG